MSMDAENMDDIEARRMRSQRIVQVTLALLSLGSLVLGLAVHVLSDRLGVPAETARFVASAFLLAATLDTVVLLYWERIFPQVR